MSNKAAATFHPHPSYTAMEAAWDPERREQARQEKESRPRSTTAPSHA